MKFQYVPEGEWINGIPLPLTTDGHPDGIGNAKPYNWVGNNERN